MPAMTGMKGAGYYDRHSAAQMSSIQALADWIDDAVTELSLPAASQPVTVLDLGSSEGRNAIRVMAGIVDKLRRRTGQPLQTIYSDLASNNFNHPGSNLRSDIDSTGYAKKKTWHRCEHARDGVQFLLPFRGVGLILTT